MPLASATDAIILSLPPATVRCGTRCLIAAGYHHGMAVEPASLASVGERCTGIPILDIPAQHLNRILGTPAILEAVRHVYEPKAIGDPAYIAIGYFTLAVSKCWIYTFARVPAEWKNRVMTNKIMAVGHPAKRPIVVAQPVAGLRFDCTMGAKDER